MTDPNLARALLRLARALTTQAVVNVEMTALLEKVAGGESLTKEEVLTLREAADAVTTFAEKLLDEVEGLAK